MRGCGTAPRNASRVYNFNKHQSGPESPQAASHEAIRILASGTVLMWPHAAPARHCVLRGSSPRLLTSTVPLAPPPNHLPPIYISYLASDSQ